MQSKGLVASFHYFCLFDMFSLHSPSRSSFLSVFSSPANLLIWDAYSRRKLAPALHQAEALPTELRCTLTEQRRTLIELRRTLTELGCTLIELRSSLTDKRRTLTELRRITLHGWGNGGGGGSCRLDVRT